MVTKQWIVPTEFGCKSRKQIKITLRDAKLEFIMDNDVLNQFLKIDVFPNAAFQHG